jgi:hypothetical protein
LIGLSSSIDLRLGLMDDLGVIECRTGQRTLAVGFNGAWEPAALSDEGAD